MTITKEQLLSMTKEERDKLSRKIYEQKNNNCSDCSNCFDCSNCSNCSDCSYCSCCSYCSNCSCCSYCSNCSNCYNCSDCSSCYGISYGHNLKYVYKGIQLTKEEYEFVLTGKVKEIPSCEGKIVEFDGKKYKLIEV